MRVDDPLPVAISLREPIVPEPEAPIVPVDPVEPDIPVDPVELVEPVVPLVPAEPVVPDMPVEPVEPVEPAVPLVPVAPAGPDMPPEPVEPDVPVAPVEPVEPAVPLDCPIAETLPATSMAVSKILVVVKVFMIKITPVKLKKQIANHASRNEKLHVEMPAGVERL